MKMSKWYLVQGETQFGLIYTNIKDEETDLIIAEFPAVHHHVANERMINLNNIVNEHNLVVKQTKKSRVRTFTEDDMYNNIADFVMLYATHDYQSMTKEEVINDIKKLILLV